MACALLKARNKLKRWKIEQILREGVQLEIDYIEDVYDCVNVCGLTKKQLVDYVKFVADHWSTRLLGVKVYRVQNPLSYMETISLQGKTNFLPSPTSNNVHGQTCKHPKTCRDRMRNVQTTTLVSKGKRRVFLRRRHDEHGCTTPHECHLRLDKKHMLVRRREYFF